MYMSKGTFEEHHCPFLTSLSVILNCTIPLPTLSSQLYTIALIGHAPPPTGHLHTFDLHGEYSFLPCSLTLSRSPST